MQHSIVSTAFESFLDYSVTNICEQASMQLSNDFCSMWHLCRGSLIRGILLQHMLTDVRCVWQVVDFWAFSEEEWGKEIMSMHHTRNALQKLTPQVSFHDLNQNACIQNFPSFADEFSVM